MAKEPAFDCRWQASLRLLVLYLALQCAALAAVLTCALPVWAKVLAVLALVGHGLWCLPRHILFSAEEAFTALHLDERGWRLFSRAGGWQPAQLLPDCIAQPQLIVLRFRLAQRRWPASRVSVVLPGDAMAPDAHRRLRVRLRFSRKRWLPAG